MKMSFYTAITRKPGTNFAAGITSVKWAEAPNYERIRGQHREYVATLTQLGLEVVVLEPEIAFPDAYFVEDTAVILDQTAVITRPGAVSRRGEVEKIVPVLEKFKKVARIQARGLLDGGDVMRVEKHLFIGLSERTNQEGARQLGEKASQLGFTWSTLPVLKGLHLKTGINYIGQHTLLMFEAYADLPELGAYRNIIVAPGEEPAANTLNINDTLLVSKGYPQTTEKLARLGMPILELGISEAAKMDGGLSCMSLRF